ncbi:MAG TPA: glycosyltransferase family 39 protein, partial [Aggregatilineales bacterium]|nr:glycosyltransferase family 39 protein [Aggregatilineales bacterium]
MMPFQKSHFVQIFTALILLLVFTLLYHETRTEVHTFDALSYTQDVESKPFIELYHPHHLLYGPVGRLTVNVAEMLGYEGRADAPIQFLNALAGAVGIMLMWRFGVRFTGHTWLPLSAAILIGLCYAYWLYAIEVEVYTFASMFILLCLWLMTYFEHSPNPQYAFWLGLATAGAVMFHQTNIMFAIPVSLFLLFYARRLMVLYLLTVGLAVGIPYLLVGWVSGFRN